MTDYSTDYIKHFVQMFMVPSRWITTLWWSPHCSSSTAMGLTFEWNVSTSIGLPWGFVPTRQNCNLIPAKLKTFSSSLVVLCVYYKSANVSMLNQDDENASMAVDSLPKGSSRCTLFNALCTHIIMINITAQHICLNLFKSDYSLCYKLLAVMFGSDC